MLTDRLLQAEYGGQALEVLLLHAEEVAREVELYAAAAVQDARDRGTGWKAVAEAARVSPTTARTRWHRREVHRKLARRAAERRRAGSFGAEGLAAGRAGAGARASGAAAARPRGLPAAPVRQAPDRGTGDWRRGARQLAAALGHLHVASGLAVCQVACEVGVSSSYVSRVLAGERVPSWSVVEKLATALGADPADLRMLWEQAQGTALGPDDGGAEGGAAVFWFRSALRGLYLAAGCPDPARLREASGGVLDARTVEELLAGSQVPAWEVVGMFVSVLRGRPADVRPLWNAVRCAMLGPVVASVRSLPASGPRDVPPVPPPRGGAGASGPLGTEGAY